MNKIFNKIMGFSNGQPERLYGTRQVKTSGKSIDVLKELAKSKGLKLYPDTNTRTYWIWRDGNSIEGTRDGFTTLSSVKSFLISYNP